MINGFSHKAICTLELAEAAASGQPEWLDKDHQSHVACKSHLQLELPCNRLLNEILEVAWERLKKVRAVYCRNQRCRWKLEVMLFCFPQRRFARPGLASSSKRTAEPMTTAIESNPNYSPKQVPFIFI